MDKVIIKKLAIKAHLSSYDDALSNEKFKQFFVSIWIPLDVTFAGKADDVTLSINYASVANSILQKCDTKYFLDFDDLVEAIIQELPKPDSKNGNKVLVEQPICSNTFIGIDVTEIKSALDEQSLRRHKKIYFIKNLQISTIIGIYPEERTKKQVVALDLKLCTDKSVNLCDLINQATQIVQESEYLTVEALAVAVVHNIQTRFTFSTVTVNIIKMEGLKNLNGEGGGVEVTRKGKTQELRMSTSISKMIGSEKKHVAYVAFGSNIEPRLHYITEALGKLKSTNMSIVNSSFLYESLPMYFTEQGKFYNGVVTLETSLTPEELLRTLQIIENETGRKRDIKNGPRTIDLDILFYDQLILDSPGLVIPHPRIHEREFVLRPLLDLNDNLLHPINLKSPKQMLRLLLDQPSVSSSLQKVLPFSGLNMHWELKTKTFVMGILNISLDSFSERGFTNIEEAVKAAEKMVEHGVDIIDIGAVSRRPGSKESLTTEEEINLLVPLIKLMRERGLMVPISVDIYKSSVATAAVNAGANFINDVGMSVRDPSMMLSAAMAGTPICFMHTRGTPLDMHNYTNYKNNDVVTEVIEELHQTVRSALEIGIFRWNIIVDPGIGFAKTGEQNTEIMKNLSKLIDENSLLNGFPLLVASSRKKFIGTLTGIEEPVKRGPGSMAAVAASISGGADIVRVHDVAENVQVSKFADAIWRN